MLLNGTSSRAETTGLGGVTSTTTAAITLAAIVRRNSTSGWDNIVSLLNGSNLTRMDLTINPSGQVIVESQTDSTGPTLSPTTGPMFLAADKPSGTSAFRFHKQIYGTDAAVSHSAGSGSTTGMIGAPTKIGVGTFDNNGDWFDGDIYAVAIWNRQLADSEHDALAAGLLAWWETNPDWLILGDWASIPSNIPDLSGKGAPLTTVTSITASSASMPIGYGAPIPLPVFQPAAGGADLTLTPGTPNVTWAGSTPARTSDISRTPGVANVDWTGSTPSLTVDKTLTPGTPNVAWAGSTPAVTVDKTLTPGTPTVAWTGSTPTLSGTADQTLTPGTANVDWTGSTPNLVMEGEVTVTPGAAEVVWTGSTPSLVITPDAVPEPPSQGAAYITSDDEDFTEYEVRNLTLRPGPAVVEWTGSLATVTVTLDPVRVKLPARRAEAMPAPAVAPRVQDRSLSPGVATVAWAGSTARVKSRSYPTVERVDALEARLDEMEREREEEFAILAFLSGR